MPQIIIRVDIRFPEDLVGLENYYNLAPQRDPLNTLFKKLEDPVASQFLIYQAVSAEYGIKPSPVLHYRVRAKYDADYTLTRTFIYRRLGKGDLKENKSALAKKISIPRRIPSSQTIEVMILNIPNVKNPHNKASRRLKELKMQIDIRI